MKGRYEDGKFIVEWDANCEWLMAPPENGRQRKYMPCEACGSVKATATNVVSMICPTCQHCAMHGHDWSDDPFPATCRRCGAVEESL